MTTISGVDFHARQQTLCYLTTEDGVISTHELKYDNREEVPNFNSRLPAPVQVGLEAGGYSLWFEELPEEIGHEILLGDALRFVAASLRVGVGRVMVGLRLKRSPIVNWQSSIRNGGAMTV